MGSNVASNQYVGLLEFHLQSRGAPGVCLASETRTVKSLEDDAHSSSVSVPIHKSRYSLQAFPRLINPGLFICSVRGSYKERHSLFVNRESLKLSPLELYSTSRSSICVSLFIFPYSRGRATPRFGNKRVHEARKSQSGDTSRDVVNIGKLEID